MMGSGVDKLINESQGKYDLTSRPENQKPQRYIFVIQKGAGKSGEITKHQSCSHQGSNDQNYFEDTSYFFPLALHVQIPQIDIVGDKLAEDNGKIVTQNAIDK